MSFLDNLLNLTPVSRLRRNHGLEHATLHVLAQHHPRLTAAGHSDLGGFWIVGNLTADDVQSAVVEALARLRSGERALAVHPNCGTNLVTSGTAAGLTAWLCMLGDKKSRRVDLDHLAMVVTMSTLAILVSQPLGLALQAKVTTSGIPETLEVTGIVTSQRGQMKAYRVITQG